MSNNGVSVSRETKSPDAKASGTEVTPGPSNPLRMSARSPISTHQAAKIRGWSWRFCAQQWVLQIFRGADLEFEVPEDGLGTAQSILEETLARQWHTLISTPSIRGSDRFTTSRMINVAKEMGITGGDPVETTYRAVQKMMQSRKDSVEGDSFSFDDICARKKNLPTSGVVIDFEQEELALLKKWFPQGQANGDKFIINMNTVFPPYTNLQEAVDAILNTERLTEVSEPEQVVDFSNQTATTGDLSLLKDLFKHKDFNSLKNTGTDFAAKHVANILKLKNKDEGGLSQVAEKTFSKNFFPVGKYNLEEFVGKTLSAMQQAGKLDMFERTGLQVSEAVQYLIFLRQSQMTVDYRNPVPTIERRAQ